ncbi:MAG: radical SAM protein, partial [Deltaproteobacteria bacterium]|nr:radical SAM protein [Deltaproteobacteria bacterium]
NMGCPHRCVFCEQEKITSQHKFPVNGRHVEKILDTAVRSRDFDKRRRPEVAFFGGTFTRLSKERIKTLLGAVAPYIKRGLFESIRVSTRPDALDKERLDLMKAYGVFTVELGAQSMDDRVLSLSNRGHTVEDTVKGVQALREYGFRVGIQLMPGLPGDSNDCFRSTITKVIRLHPDMVRLYPALVIRGTELVRWYSEGRYLPLSLEEAVEICIEGCMRLESEDIPVIRIGLMSSPTLLEEGQIVAGPWHTAFGFLVRSGIHLKKIASCLPGQGEMSLIRIYAPKREVNLVRGYKNKGIKWIEQRTGARVVGVESDDSIAPGRVRIENI